MSDDTVRYDVALTALCVWEHCQHQLRKQPATGPYPRWLEKCHGVYAARNRAIEIADDLEAALDGLTEGERDDLLSIQSWDWEVIPMALDLHVEHGREITPLLLRQILIAARTDGKVQS